MTRRATLVLIRHTETDWNTQHRYSGQSDVPRLTQKGINDATRLGASLKYLSCSALVCSDLTRAIDTAACIGKQMGLEPIIDKRLREVGLGQADGIFKAEARIRYAALPHISTRHQNFDFSPIGGESKQEVLARHHEIAREYVERYGTTHGDLPLIIFVGHGTSLRVFLEDHGLDEIPQASAFMLPYAYTPAFAASRLN